VLELDGQPVALAGDVPDPVEAAFETVATRYARGELPDDAAVEDALRGLGALDAPGLMDTVRGSLERFRKLVREDPAQALELGVHAFFAFVDRNRDSWRVLFDDTVPPSGQLARWVGDHRDRIETMVARALLARMPARRRQRAAVEVEALSVALLAASEALARWWVRTGALSAAQAADLLVTTIEPGLRARATGQGAAA